MCPAVHEQHPGTFGSPLPPCCTAGWGCAGGGTLCYCSRRLGMTGFFPALNHSSKSSSVQEADHCPVTESHRGILKLATSSQHQGKEVNTLLQVSREECKEVPAAQLHHSGC